ncbi:MAG: putative oxidoreductase [Arenicella sp.]|jgi:putative oxidoreductase
MKFLDNYQDHSYALLRIVSGFLFLWHGAQKFFNFPIEFPYGPLNPITTAAGTIELLGGTLIMIGLFTRPAAFICSGTMAAAYWMAHGSKSFFPIANGGEIAALFCFIFLFIATRGAGIWSFDKKPD